MNIILLTGINPANPIKGGSKELATADIKDQPHCVIRELQLFQKKNLASNIPLTRLKMTRIWLSLI